MLSIVVSQEDYSEDLVVKFETCDKNKDNPNFTFDVISDQAINSYEMYIIAMQMSLPFYSKDV